MAFVARGLLVPAALAPRAGRLGHGLAFVACPDDVPSSEHGLDGLDWAARTAAATAPEVRTALIEVECWGACSHGAVGFERGAVAFGPLRTRDEGDDRAGYAVVPRRESAVNQVLRWLGVTPAEGCADEFASVGFERLRR